MPVLKEHNITVDKSFADCTIGFTNPTKELKKISLFSSENIPTEIQEGTYSVDNKNYEWLKKLSQQTNKHFVSKIRLHFEKTHSNKNILINEIKFNYENKESNIIPFAAKDGADIIHDFILGDNLTFDLAPNEGITITFISAGCGKSFAIGFCKLIKEKAHFVNEFWSLGSFFFVSPTDYDKEVLKKRLNPQTLSYVKEVKTAFEVIQNFTATETEQAFKAVSEKLNIPTGQVMQLFRVAITGVGGGPALFEMLELFGKEDSLKRLDAAITYFEKQG